jgi:uncharacterized cofD-like protein
MQEMPDQLNLVAIGGGTGLSSLLSGLKHYVNDGRSYDNFWGMALNQLTAVVTVTDDGGSSGRLREEFHILPPGDIRNCMAALSEDGQLLAKLFQYRFPGEGNLNGHSFGNLFLTALTGVTGDFLQAIKLSSGVLAIRGRIFPSTTTDVVLVAELDNGQVVRGETTISKFGPRVKRMSLSPERCFPLEETLQAIKQADIITLGPGSLFTSIIPNLLVSGIPSAIAESPAIKVCILNIMTQPGETSGLGVKEHLAALFDAAPELNLDYIIINCQPISTEFQKVYLADGAVQIGLSEALLPEISCYGRNINVIAKDLLDETSDKVRHCPEKLAKAVFQTYQDKLSKLSAKQMNVNLESLEAKTEVLG